MEESATPFPGVPYSDRPIDHGAPPHELHTQIKDMCVNLIPSWRDIDTENIEITIISGGISNALYKITPSPPHPPNNSPSLLPVTFRIYGSNTEKFIDRTREINTMLILHRQGFGSQILGIFSNGRIESFLPMRCLTPEEMCSPKYAPRIAQTLARFHHVDHTNAPLTASTPFDRIYEWLSVVRDLDFSYDKKKKAIFDTFNVDELLEQVKEVQQVALMCSSPIVFAHNDLLSGNIMIRDDDVGEKKATPCPSATTTTTTTDAYISLLNNNNNNNNNQESAMLTFIDFEYSDWAPRGFDIGNHFCEYAGFECDYTRYPDHAAASLFIKNYLEGQRQKQCIGDDEVKKCVVESNVYSLTAHMYWGTWALMQARWSAIDFDYMGYAALRWREYRRRKEEFLNQGRAVFG